MNSSNEKLEKLSAALKEKSKQKLISATCACQPEKRHPHGNRCNKCGFYATNNLRYEDEKSYAELIK